MTSNIDQESAMEFEAAKMEFSKNFTQACRFFHLCRLAEKLWPVTLEVTGRLPRTKFFLHAEEERYWYFSREDAGGKIRMGEKLSGPYYQLKQFLQHNESYKRLEGEKNFRVSQAVSSEQEAQIEQEYLGKPIEFSPDGDHDMTMWLFQHREEYGEQACEVLVQFCKAVVAFAREKGVKFDTEELNKHIPLESRIGTDSLTEISLVKDIPTVVREVDGLKGEKDYPEFKVLSPAEREKRFIVLRELGELFWDAYHRTLALPSDLKGGRSVKCWKTILEMVKHFQQAKLFGGEREIDIWLERYGEQLPDVIKAMNDYIRDVLMKVGPKDKQKKVNSVYEHTALVGTEPRPFPSNMGELLAMVPKEGEDIPATLFSRLAKFYTIEETEAVSVPPSEIKTDQLLEALRPEDQNVLDALLSRYGPEVVEQYIRGRISQKSKQSGFE